jgi:FlaA1/EpsC-like NDP-sugar epimerase
MARGSTLSRASLRVKASIPLVLLDIFLTAAAYALILLLRFNGPVPLTNWEAFRRFLPLALLIHIGANRIAGLYGQMWRYASIAEARRVLLAGFGAAGALLVASFAWNSHMSRSVIIAGAMLATFFMGAMRFQSRLFAFKRGQSRGAFGMRVALVGAGPASATLVRQMLHSPNQGLVPVVVVDDDRRKHGLSLLGVPVVGGTEHLVEAIHRFDAQQVVLAVADAEPEYIQRIADAAEEANAPLKVLPSVSDIVPGTPSVKDVRDLRIEDLLGRTQVAIDLDGVRALLANRTVLITGAGSIGSELAQQIAELGPARVALLDHDETHLHDAAATLDVPTVQILADIRDCEATYEALRGLRPDVVFHAAAHKHVPLLEDHPWEAVTTNIVGTANVLDAVSAVGVERFVLISTDKAVRPASVMGASKWVCEQLVLNCSGDDARYCSVRFGNVLGSRGSVIPTFARQIAAGGPVTVTHPSMSRFFMSVHEAVQLVLQASVFVEGGEIFVLEMGTPINIRELAERMIRLSGRAVGSEIPIRISGVRPGEKFAEELRVPDERADSTAHPSILRLRPVALPTNVLEHGVARLTKLAHDRDPEVTSALFDLVAAAGIDHRRRVLDLAHEEARTNGNGSSLRAEWRARGLVRDAT